MKHTNKTLSNMKFQIIISVIIIVVIIGVVYLVIKRKAFKPQEYSVENYPLNITVTILEKNNNNFIVEVLDFGDDNLSFISKKKKYLLATNNDTKFFTEDDDSISFNKIKENDKLKINISNVILETDPPQFDYYKPKVILIETN